MNIEHLKKIDEIEKEMIEVGYVPGVLTMILEDSKPVYYSEMGYADLENKIPVKKDSIFRLYSMSKPITSAAIMLLMQDGKIDVNCAVGDFISTYKNQVYLSKNGEKLPVKRAMKVKDLLNMTAGLTYGGNNNENEKMTSALTEEGISRLDTDNEMTTMEFAERMGEIPLIFSPGDSFSYSYCADILGAIVEVVSGMTFGEFLKKRLFEPLEMVDTGFFVPEEKQHRLVKVYEQKDGKLKEFHYNNLNINLPMKHEPAFQSGGAGLCTTITDYSHFAEMLMNKGVFRGKRIMEEGTVKYMTQGTMDTAPREAIRSWDGLDGFDYANLLRVMKDPGRAVTFGSLGEYGWDGWLGPYFINDPAHKITILHMIQRTDAGTTPYMRRIRNVVYAAAED